MQIYRENYLIFQPNVRRVRVFSCIKVVYSIQNMLNATKKEH